MKASKLFTLASCALAPAALLLLVAGQRYNPAMRQGQPTPALVAQWQLIPGAPAPHVANNYWDTIQTGNPQVLFDEDFTDGAFDGPGALNPDPRRANNWNIFGANAGFHAPDSRTTFPVSLARKPSKGGADWEGAQFIVYQDLDGDGRYTTDEKKKWLVDKKDEVCVVTYTSFSDLASRPELYGTEVAFLEDVSAAAYQGHPHYGHDLSWEVLQVHSSDRTQASVQLEPNVENTGNRFNIGVLRAHYNTWPDDNILAREYTQTVIWRNVLNSGTTNVEQWGELRHGDMMIPKEMKSDLEPTNRYSVFNNVQIALFRANIRTQQPILVRSTLTARDSAQVGILRCKVGITKKADFDLSYAVDGADLAILTQNLGRRDSANIRTGDANNDTKVDANDANALFGLWTANVPAYDTIRAAATYNPANGHIILNLKNIHYLSIQSLNRRLLPAGVSLTGLNAQGSYVTDSAIVAYSDASGWNVTNLDLGPAAALALQSGELTLRVNYLGSKESEGFVVPFGQALVTNLPGLAGTNTLKLDGQQWQIPVAKGPLRISVLTTDGKMLMQQQVEAAPLMQLQHATLPRVPKIITVQDAKSKRVFTKTYLNTLP